MRIRQADYVTCATGYPVLLAQSSNNNTKQHYNNNEQTERKHNNPCLPSPHKHSQSPSPCRLLPLRETITEYYNRELGIGLQHVGYLQNGRDFNYSKVHKNRYNEQIKDNQTTSNWQNCLIKKTKQQQEQTYRSARVAAQLSEQTSPTSSTLEDEQNAF